MYQSEATWEKLSQVAVAGAEYDSSERLPHPKCLEGTRVNLLDHVDVLLDNQDNQLVWLNGTAGVGKSAVAFTVAEKMRGLKVKESSKERRLAGTFFFSRKYTDRCTTGSFFATLVHQLASNFPSVKDDLIAALREDHTLLDPRKSLRKQMEALFLPPLRRLKFRLFGCPPLVFVVDALDECTSEAEITELISLLGQALREPDLPVTHILLTSRSEAHIRKAIHEEEVRPIVREIPVETSGKGILISLDGADVDNDIYTFLKHSFADKQSYCPNFPQPTKDQLARLASRAGRRFIVASTMMNFIDDGHNDPSERLQLLLKLTNKLLRGTEVYRLYDHILSTCAKPGRAYMHLSVVAALANPLPISQISELLGAGQGRDVDAVLVQLRSVMDIPADSSLPVNIYHSSILDYALNPSNCGLSVVKDQCITPPHSLLAYSSFRLMIRNLPKSSGLLDALVELKKQSQVMESHPPQSLRQSLAFIVEPPTAMRIIMALLWLRGDYELELDFWLNTPDGRAWLCTEDGQDWLHDTHETSSQQNMGWRQWHSPPNEQEWLQTPNGREWLDTWRAHMWLDTWNGNEWLNSPSGQEWAESPSRREWLTTVGHRIPQSGGGLPIASGQEWLQTLSGRRWVHTKGQTWLQTPTGQEWLRTWGGREWLGTIYGMQWLCTLSGQDWLETPGGLEWLDTDDGQDWLSFGGKCDSWLQTSSGVKWLQTPGGLKWLQTPGGRRWPQTPSGQEWLQTPSGREWLQTLSGRKWLQTPSGREWLQATIGREWLQTPQGQVWQSTPAASVWAHMETFLDTVEAISEFRIVSELSPLSTFQAIQQFKSLPDFLMFPAFLISIPQSPTPAVAQSVDMEIIHAIKAFVSFTNEAQERSQSASNAVAYACQNWAMHLSRTPNPWNNILNLKDTFRVFWDDYLLSWLERQWCLRGLQSCLIVLSEGQELAKEHLHVPTI